MNGFRCVLPTVLCCLAAVGRSQSVTAQTAIAIDGASGKVLWSKNADQSMYPASTTKIMTGLLLVERCHMDDVITAPEDIETIREASMHLKPGEKVTVRNMLYAIMLRSANDGCYAVAKHISGSVEAFSKLMNERARQVGCTRTHFHNPNGLNDRDHTTTAHDLALIARAAMMHPEFREVVKTYKYQIDRSINQHDRVMINHDKLLKKDPFAEGIKTGYTVPAGHCFVGSSSRNGFRVITVVMKSNRWQDDSEALMSWAFQSFEKKEKMPAGQVVGKVAVPDGAGAAIPVSLAEPAYTLGPIGENQPKPKTEVKPLTDLRAPVKKGDVVGSLEIVDADNCLQRVPVVAEKDVTRAGLIGITKPESTGSKLFFGGALFVGAFLVKGRANKRKKYYGRTTTRPKL